MKTAALPGSLDFTERVSGLKHELPLCEETFPQATGYRPPTPPAEPEPVDGAGYWAHVVSPVSMRQLVPER